MKHINYKKIKSFKDIEITKGKLRYEMLVTENNLYEALLSMERFLSFASFFSRFSSGVSRAQGAVSLVSRLFGKIFHKKGSKKTKGVYSPEDIK